jgi:hypothetical protein
LLIPVVRMLALGEEGLGDPQHRHAAVLRPHLLELEHRRCATRCSSAFSIPGADVDEGIVSRHLDVGASAGPRHVDVALRQLGEDGALRTDERHLGVRDELVPVRAWQPGRAAGEHDPLDALALLVRAEIPFVGLRSGGGASPAGGVGSRPRTPSGRRRP